MLYPDFNDLISYKERKFDKMSLGRFKSSASSSGNHDSPFRGQGLDFDGVREYVPGDDIRNIDWRVTARTGLPHLKLFKEEKERHTILCLDMNSSMRFGTRNTFKSIQAARSFSLLGWRALAHQDRISACFFGDVSQGLQYFAPKRTSRAICMMLKTLASPPQEYHQVPLETALKQICQVAHSGSLVYVISDFLELSSDMMKNPSISRLTKSCDVVFIAINDAAEKALVPAGLIHFCGGISQKILVNTDSAQGRANYAALWKENRIILKTLTERFKIPLIELSTESDIQRELLFALKRGIRRKKCLL